MKVSIQSRRFARLQYYLFIGLFLCVIGLLAWLSTRYVYQADWTASGRNTLSEASVALLKELPGPVEITAYARETPLMRKRISAQVGRYQRYKPDLTMDFVNPDKEPERVRELGITLDGELIISYQGRSENVQDISENGITNALQRVARGSERQLVFLEGHGERSPTGEASYDLAGWARQLTSKGIKVVTQNLVNQAQILQDTAVVIIVGPRADYLAAEVTIIKDYLSRGGNLLWLAEPGDLHGLEPLAQQLGIGFQPGMIVDPNIFQVGLQLFGTDDPRVALVASYGDHAIVSGFEFNTLFPVASGIQAKNGTDWLVEAFLQTLSNAWSETGETLGQINYDAGSDIEGPLSIGVALQRDRDSGSLEGLQQRVVVIGDGDFVSNGFLGLGGNLQLAMNVINWLNADDALIAIPAKTAPDPSLQLSQTGIAVIGFGFLFVLPLGLLASGLFIWLRRRRR